MEDYLQTMKYTGPQASAMGVGIGDLSAAIAVLGEHGIKGSQAGTTMRRMFTNLIPASKAAAATMEELGMITADGGNVFFDSAGKNSRTNRIHSRLNQWNEYRSIHIPPYNTQTYITV
jgi:TP901 family phage tail tape measure protein